MILHLVTRQEWDAIPADLPYTPAAYEADGFIHCTAGDDLLLQVANRLYRDQAGEYLALSIDESKVTAPVKWEPAAPGAEPPPEALAEYGRPTAGQSSAAYPHIYGPLNRSAIVAVRRMARGPDGTFIGYAPEETATSPDAAPAPAGSPAPTKPPQPQQGGTSDPLNPLNIKSPSQMADELLKATDDFSEALARFKDSVEARIEQIDQDIESKL